MTLLFGATIVLPCLVLAVLAYRALVSDRRLAEQLWRERLQDATWRTYAHLERQVLEFRSRAEELAPWGEPRRKRHAIPAEWRGLSISPDGKHVATTRMTQRGQLWALENFLPAAGRK